MTVSACGADTGDGRSSDLVTTDVERAIAVIRSGGLVAIPTETVYGLAADATCEAAVERIFEVKGRPPNHPLIVHLSGADQLDRWAAEVSEPTRRLTDAAWPGPLTVIVPRAHGVLDVVTGGRNTVGLRVPAHHMALELLASCGVALAAPSANRFGSVSPTTAAHVVRDLGDHLDPARDLILDGGACPIGVESTIVDCTTTPPQMLRAGAVSVEDVERLLADAVAPASGPSRASGMLASHYAPRCVIRLAETRSAAETLRRDIVGSEVLDLTDDTVVYAHELYARLRDADDRGVDTVIAVLPAAAGIGHAIRDRLAKAAAPRSP